MDTTRGPVADATGYELSKAPRPKEAKLRKLHGVNGTTVILVAGCFALAACGDDPIVPGDPDPASSFTATVDGEEWVAVPPGISATNSGDTLLAVTARDSSGAFIVFSIPAAQPGSYAIGPAWASYFFDEGLHHWFADESGGSGMIVVTTLTAHRISGTIHFEAVAVSDEPNTTVAVTGGAFDVAF